MVWGRESSNESCKISNSLEYIPPTADALLNHLKRSILQFNVWVNCVERYVPRLNPSTVLEIIDVHAKIRSGGIAVLQFS